jgi:UDP-2,3-diacylglucosamine pyrophosphatase LpxH
MWVQAMQQTCVVVSDLHLSDGSPQSERFHQFQQDALDGLLTVLEPAGTLGQATGVELVINGDCFDCLLTPPAVPGRQQTDAALGIAKIERIIAAHPPFFAALRRFLANPTHRLTFTIGNHDVELCFAEVRARVREAIGAEPGRARFCLSQAYRPLSDVELEHGCQFDPWNRIPELWDGFWPLYDLMDDGREHTGAGPERVTLPWGSRHYYAVTLPIHQRFPYLEALIPLVTANQILTVLCLFAPELVLQGAPHSAALRVPPQPALVGLAPGDEHHPAALFAAAWPDLTGLQWQVLEQAGITLDTATRAKLRAAADALGVALAKEPLAALGAIFHKTADKEMHIADTDPAAKNMFLRDAAIQIALIGHTHEEGTLRLPDQKLFLDTGTWTNRLFQPSQTEQTGTLVEWLRAPEQSESPLRDATRLTFALLQAVDGGPTTAQLCEWIGGRDGSYRPLPANV